MTTIGGAVDPDRRPDMRVLRFTSFTCRIEFATFDREVSLLTVRRRLENWGRRFSRFDPASEVNQFIDQAGRWVEVSTHLHRLLVLSLRAAVKSRGLFNVAVPFGARAAEPCLPLTEVLEVGRGVARIRPGASVDFGGLAKGVWADRVREMLGPDAACSIGGDVACRGAGPAGEGWPVGLPDGRVVMLERGAIATSGVGRRMRGGEHHIVDPSTGRPSASDIRVVSVLAPRCAEAEWMATAMVVAGSDFASTLRGERAAAFPAEIGLVDRVGA